MIAIVPSSIGALKITSPSPLSSFHSLFGISWGLENVIAIFGAASLSLPFSVFQLYNLPQLSLSLSLKIKSESSSTSAIRTSRRCATATRPRPAQPLVKLELPGVEKTAVSSGFETERCLFDTCFTIQPWSFTVILTCFLFKKCWNSFFWAQESRHVEIQNRKTLGDPCHILWVHGIGQAAPVELQTFRRDGWMGALVVLKMNQLVVIWVRKTEKSLKNIRKHNCRILKTHCSQTFLIFSFDDWRSAPRGASTRKSKAPAGMFRRSNEVTKQDMPSW